MFPAARHQLEAPHLADEVGLRWLLLLPGAPDARAASWVLLASGIEAACCGVRSARSNLSPWRCRDDGRAPHRRRVSRRTCPVSSRQRTSPTSRSGPSRPSSPGQAWRRSPPSPASSSAAASRSPKRPPRRPRPSRRRRRHPSPSPRRPLRPRRHLRRHPPRPPRRPRRPPRPPPPPAPAPKSAAGELSADEARAILGKYKKY